MPSETPWNQVSAVANCDHSRKFQTGDTGTEVSPKGDRALLVVHSEIMFGKTKADDTCRVEWIGILRIDGHWRKIIVATKDGDWDLEYHFELIGWSADGQLLLMAMATVGDGWDDTIPVVYDVQQDRIWSSELPDVFGPQNPENCPLSFRPAGFDSSGKVVVDVSARDSSDLASVKRACFEKSTWRFDFTRGSIEPAPDGLTIEKFGTFLPPPPPRK